MPKPKRITPAFPNKGDNSPENDYYDGMSLRDYFAAKAMEGIIASYSGQDIPLPNCEHTAMEAFEYADAMLSAREVSDAKG
jgi:hypothetical protein